MPYFILQLIKLLTQNVRSSKNPITSVTHHGLIKLLVIDALSCTNHTWEALFQEPKMVE